MDHDVWVGLLLGVIALGGLVASFFWREHKQNAQHKAMLDYGFSLQSLRQDPNNPELRQRTLILGRHYSNLMRDSKGVTIFDEMAVMNDINAACARATVGQDAVAKVEVTNAAALGGDGPAKEIEKLGQLFLAGVLTADEFERGKSLFLGAAPDKAASAVALLQNLDTLKKNGVLSESEFNMKKWEILSERLIPGKMQAAKL